MCQWPQRYIPCGFAARPVVPCAAGAAPRGHSVSPLQRVRRAPPPGAPAHVRAWPPDMHAGCGIACPGSGAFFALHRVASLKLELLQPCIGVTAGDTVEDKERFRGPEDRALNIAERAARPALRRRAAQYAETGTQRASLMAGRGKRLAAAVVVSGTGPAGRVPLAGRERQRRTRPWQCLRWVWGRAGCARSRQHPASRSQAWRPPGVRRGNGSQMPPCAGALARMRRQVCLVLL